MQRHFIVAVVVVSLAASAAAISLRPEITGVVPDAPAPSRTSQPTRREGREFAPGLSLSVTSPTGAVADYRGNAIAEQRESSFRVAVLLADVGTYRLVVNNPDGQASMPFSLGVKAPSDGPIVREVKPTGLRISTSPQTLTVEGARFDAGLIVSVTDPGRRCAEPRRRCHPQRPAGVVPDDPDTGNGGPLRIHRHESEWKGIEQRRLRRGPALRTGALQLDLHSNLHDPFRRNPEERRGADGVAGHEGEEALSPERHAGTFRGDEGFDPEEKRGLLRSMGNPGAGIAFSATGMSGSCMNPYFSASAVESLAKRVDVNLLA